MKYKLDQFTKVELSENSIKVSPKDNTKRSKQMWGTVRSRIFNIIHGVTEGFNKNLVLNGVGYKAILKGKILELNLGYSHPINFNIPEDIKISVSKPTEINIFGVDKSKLTIGIRPENFKINNNNGKKKSKSFNAKVVEKSFMGDTMLYGINLGENDHNTYRISISDIKNSASPNIGEEISVYFQEDDIVAYFEE